MFTGIITAIGTIHTIKKTQESMQLAIKMNNLNTDYLRLGDSIAVNGVCLTVTELENNIFHADVMPTTFQATNLKSLTVGSSVNLERALGVTERLNGHFVTGHVDTVVNIIKKFNKQNATYFVFNLPTNLAKYIVHKGSIAIDGISLTVAEVTNNSFTISMIPHSIKHTIMAEKNIGDPVNLEVDLLAKYILNQEKTTQIDKNFLQTNGF